MTSPHQHLYDTGYWKRRSRLQLKLHPLCIFCEKQGKVTRARVADHVTKHDGDPNAFYCGELQSLCWSCHSSRKQQIEKLGYDPTIGIDGLPIDPAHPVYRR
jgi:5-methylcytosine-specific restriction protein A